MAQYAFYHAVHIRTMSDNATRRRYH